MSEDAERSAAEVYSKDGAHSCAAARAMRDYVTMRAMFTREMRRAVH